MSADADMTNAKKIRIEDVGDAIRELTEQLAKGTVISDKYVTMPTHSHT